MRLQGLNPDDGMGNRIKCMCMIGKANGLFLILTVTIGILYQFQSSSFYIFCLLFYLINNYYIQYLLYQEELKLLIDFEEYLDKLRYYYNTGVMIDEAVFDSMEGLTGASAVHINRIYDILISDETDMADIYKETIPNNYLLTFLTICRITMHFGDSKANQDSVFLSNINNLREEINIEILKQKQIAHIFSGLFFLSTFPVCFLKLIEDWGISNIPELADYYYGGYGIVVSLLIIFCTLISSHLIYLLKGGIRRGRREHLVLERIYNLPFMKYIVDRYCFIRAAKTHRLDILLKRYSTGMSIQQFLAMRFMLFIMGCFFSTLLFLYITGIFRLLYILISVICGLGISYSSFIPLAVRQTFLRMIMEDEVIRLQTVIIMMKDIKSMNRAMLLEWMEQVSDIFNISLLECELYYYYDEDLAFERLKQAEPFLPFVRIVEDLESCDQVGIERAFDDVKKQREFILSRRKQENDINITNRGVIGKAAGYTPLILTVGLYLIVPFIGESVSQLMGFLEQFQKLL